MGCSLGLTVFADTYKGSVWAFHLAEGINNKLIKINTNEGKLTINTFEGDNNPTGRGPTREGMTDSEGFAPCGSA